MNSRSTLVYSPGAFGPVLFALDDNPLEWQAFALCAEVDGELFFPEKGGTIRHALAICGECPVAAQCLEYQLGYERTHGGYGIHGVFGGKSAKEREDILAAERQQELGMAA